MSFCAQPLRSPPITQAQTGWLITFLTSTVVTMDVTLSVVVCRYMWWINDTGSVNKRVCWQLLWQTVTDVTQSMKLLLFCRWQVEGGEDISIDVPTFDQGHVCIYFRQYCNHCRVAGSYTKLYKAGARHLAAHVSACLCPVAHLNTCVKSAGCILLVPFCRFWM